MILKEGAPISADINQLHFSSAVRLASTTEILVPVGLAAAKLNFCVDPQIPEFYLHVIKAIS